MARKNATKRRRMSKLSPFTVVGVIVLCTVLCTTTAYKSVALKAESKKYEAQIAKLQEEKDSLADEKEKLQDQQEYVKTDKYVEEIAREKLGLVYSDEIIFEPSDK